jgi:hypothetical protein
MSAGVSLFGASIGFELTLPHPTRTNEANQCLMQAILL